MTQIIELREYEKQEVDILAPHHVTTLREDCSRYVTIRPGWLPDTWQLEAKQYIGIIVVDDLQIRIHPKTPVHNLFYMLTYIYDLPEFRDEMAELTVSEDIFAFIVRIFLQQVETIIQRGIYRSYVETQENAVYLKGRLLLDKQLQMNAMHPERFYQRTQAYTADLLENQILQHTLWFIAQIWGQSLDETSSERTETTSVIIAQLRRLRAAFADVTPRLIEPSEFAQIHYTRLNEHYRPAIHLARLLLQHLSLEHQPETEPNRKALFPAYLFNMNYIFESFVAKYLQTRFHNHPNLHVDIQPAIWLDQHHTTSGRPDIVLCEHEPQQQVFNQPICVLDTKYKRFDRQPEEHDRNQVYLYCRSLDVREGVLIYADDHPVNYQAEFPEVTLRGMGLSLAGERTAFDARCQVFAKQFEHLYTLGKSIHFSTES
ncbi:MAG: hypothetical protein AAF639_35885 [Chloroflexota bacterium]